MKTQLLRIANTLAVYGPSIEGNGLFSGKMGIVLYLYYYSRFSGYEYYNDCADQLLDRVLNDAANTSNEFEDGLAGIGWSIDHLMKHKFIDGDNKLFENIDIRLLSHVNINQYTVFGNGLYLLMRMKYDAVDKKYFRDQLVKITNLWYDKLVKTDIVVPVCHLNSVLYFFTRSFRYGYIEDSDDKLKLLLVALFNDTFANGNFDAADLNITSKILSRVGHGRGESWSELAALVEKYKDTKNEDCVDSFIKTSLFDMCLFDDRYFNIPTESSVSMFITKKQTSLMISDFGLARGLAGLGCGLCRSMPVNAHD